MAKQQNLARDKSNFHEAYSPGEVKLPSPRSTGFVFAVIAVLAGVIFRENMTVVIAAACIALALAATSVLAPQLLQPLNIVWFKFGMLLHRVVNPVVMFLMFALAFVPMGLLMRLFHDPLRLKRKNDVESYWIEPDAAEAKLSSMKNQF